MESLMRKSSLGLLIMAQYQWMGRLLSRTEVISKGGECGEDAQSSKLEMRVEHWIQIVGLALTSSGTCGSFRARRVLKGPSAFKRDSVHMCESHTNT